MAAMKLPTIPEAIAVAPVLRGRPMVPNQRLLAMTRRLTLPTPSWRSANDTNGDFHNNGKYAMYITVSQPDHGPNAIKEGENLNPVRTPSMRYDAWRKEQPASFR